MKDKEIKKILDDLKKTADNTIFVVCSSQEELDKMPKYTANFLSINDRKASLLLDYITNLQKEIERLNNIINELEKYINETKLKEFEKEYGRRYSKTFTQAEVIICNMILDKLQELKGSDKE